MAVTEVQVISDIVCANYSGATSPSATTTAPVQLYQKTYPGGRSASHLSPSRGRPTTYPTCTALQQQHPPPPPTASTRQNSLTVRLAHSTPARREAPGPARAEGPVPLPGVDFRWGGAAGSAPGRGRRAGPPDLIRLAAAAAATTTTKGATSVRDAVAEGLFDAYHAREGDVLRGVAVAANIDGEEAEAWLDSDEDVELVDGEAARNREMLRGSGVWGAGVYHSGGASVGWDAGSCGLA
ncbi:hypothetical protein Hte_012545 [Hypoxylon texense]